MTPPESLVGVQGQCRAGNRVGVAADVDPDEAVVLGIDQRPANFVHLYHVYSRRNAARARLLDIEIEADMGRVRVSLGLVRAVARRLVLDIADQCVQALIADDGNRRSLAAVETATTQLDHLASRRTGLPSGGRRSMSSGCRHQPQARLFFTRSSCAVGRPILRSGGAILAS